MKNKILFALSLMFLIISIMFALIYTKNYNLENPKPEDLSVIDVDHGSKGSSALAYHPKTRKMFFIINDDETESQEVHPKVDENGEHKTFEGTTTVTIID